MTFPAANSKTPPAKLWSAALAIFLLAFSIRLLMWQDARFEGPLVQRAVAADYERTARLISQSGVNGLFDPQNPLADPNLLGHPPGYPLVRSLVAEFFGYSNSAIQLFQITCDSLAAVVIFLIAFDLLVFTPAFIAGLLVAFAPQFAWNSVLLLPDTLAVFPLLLAVLLLIKALKNPRVLSFVGVGLLLGASCWLRANAMLIALFIGLAAALLLKERARLRYAGTLVLASIVTIGVLTARNWIVHHYFIPVSLGAGQTMLEGIADYDADKSLNIPATDMGIMKLEAEENKRPDYYTSLFSPDGVKRERTRIKRGLGIMAQHPVWFFTVMVRRSASMLQLERARNVSPFAAFSQKDLRTTLSPQIVDLKASEWQSTLDYKAEKLSLDPTIGEHSVRITTDDSKQEDQLRWRSLKLRPRHDYLLRVPVRIEQGRVILEVRDNSSARILTSTAIELEEGKEQTQHSFDLELPFATSSDGVVSIVIRNGAAVTGKSILQLGAIQIHQLGPTSNTWTRYPRIVIAIIQQFFITAWMLPLALLGIALLIYKRDKKALILLLVVPVYYLSTQSLLHTEYRYVLAIHYFLFVFVGVTLHQVSQSGHSLLINFFKRDRNMKLTDVA